MTIILKNKFIDALCYFINNIANTIEVTDYALDESTETMDRAAKVSRQQQLREQWQQTKKLTPIYKPTTSNKGKVIYKLADQGLQFHKEVAQRSPVVDIGRLNPGLAANKVVKDGEFYVFNGQTYYVSETANEVLRCTCTNADSPMIRCTAKLTMTNNLTIIKTTRHVPRCNK